MFTREITERECSVLGELYIRPSGRPIVERPVFLKNETDEHRDKECDDRAGEIRHTEHIQRMKYAEIHADTDYAGNKKFQDAHGVIVAPGEIR